MKLVYVVTMYRWGNREKHSYVVGVYSSYESAIETAKLEVSSRGGKYEAEVLRIPLDAPWSMDLIYDPVLKLGEDVRR
jgi:hypothetical protein